MVSSTAAHADRGAGGLRAPGRRAPGDRAAVRTAAAVPRRRGVTGMNPARTRKLGDRIAQIVAEMLERRIKDPRLGFVTVTEARVTGDLREATVFYTVYGSEEEQAGHRRRAGQRDRPDQVRGRPPDRASSTPRRSPSSWTRCPTRPRTIEDLVARARAADAAVAATREGAVPAGDPDPYRTRRPRTTRTTRTTTTTSGRRADDCERNPGRRRTVTRDTRRRDGWRSRQSATSRPSGRAALKIIGGAPEICLACHVRPDGDALGSMLAVAQRAVRRGRPPARAGRSPRSATSPSRSRHILRFLPGVGAAHPAGGLPGAARG